MKGIKLRPADIAFSKCIRYAAGHTCERCGIFKPPTGLSGSAGMENSHNFSRSHRTIRWCKENCLCLCTKCHQWFGANPADSGRWLELKIGTGTLEILREKRDSKIKVSKLEEREIAAHYRAELKHMETTNTRDFDSYQ